MDKGKGMVENYLWRNRLTVGSTPDWGLWMLAAERGSEQRTVSSLRKCVPGPKVGGKSLESNSIGFFLLSISHDFKLFFNEFHPSYK